MDNNYTVYMHICPKNEPKKRWGNGKCYNSSIYFKKAIDKYGWENIQHRIIYTNLSKEEAEKQEQLLIKYYKSNNRNYGYNIANGGHINRIETNDVENAIKEMNKNEIGYLKVSYKK